MLGDLEKVQYPEKSRLKCQLRSDIRESDRLDRIYLDFSILHAIPTANADPWARPNSDGICDLSSANSLAKPLGKYHAETVTFVGVLLSSLAHTRDVPDMPGWVHDAANPVVPWLIFGRKQNACTSLYGSLDRKVWIGKIQVDHDRGTAVVLRFTACQMRNLAMNHE